MFVLSLWVQLEQLYTFVKYLVCTFKVCSYDGFTRMGMFFVCFFQASPFKRTSKAALV